MPDLYIVIEKYARKFFPSSLGPIGKKIISYPRFYAQLKKCRQNYERYKNRYPQPILYVAGLPKSGTTWLEKMLGSFPGFSDVMIPSAVSYEQAHKESHSYDFPENTFSQMKNALVVLKLHSHGSQNNFDILKKNHLRYVVIFRDLRDVAVSYIFYVKRTTYHPEHRIYKNLDTKAALKQFGNTILPEYVKWVESWYQHDKSDLSYILRYEDLQADPVGRLTDIAKHYGIYKSDSEIEQIVEQNNFKNLSGGRDKGAGDTKSFFRKGVSGDWKNHFDEELTQLYNSKLKDFNSRYAYEI